MWGMEEERMGEERMEEEGMEWRLTKAKRKEKKSRKGKKALQDVLPNSQLYGYVVR